MKYSEMADIKLKEEYLSLSSMINDIDCYGVSDVQSMEFLEEELNERGYEIIKRTVIEFVKKEVEI